MYRTLIYIKLLLLMFVLLAVNIHISVAEEEPLNFKATTMTPIMNDKTNTQMGAEVRGVQLSELQGRDLAAKLLAEVYNQRMLIFKQQDIIDDEEFVDIVKIFGKELETNQERHQSTDEQAVFVASNDPTEKLGINIEDGMLWHIGGYAYDTPYSISFYMFTKTPKNSPIAFAPLDDVLDDVTPEKKAYWDTISIRVGYNPEVVHPLIHHHPKTDLETLCFDIEGMYSIILNKDTPLESVGSDQELEGLQTDLITTLSEKWRYSHKWEPGDVIMVDNLSTAQLYLPSHVLDPKDVGLFVMKRINIMGAHKPKKRPGTEKPESKRLSEEPGDDIAADMDEENNQHSYKVEL